MIRPSVFGFLLVCMLLAASGCRSYGGYDSEEATYQQILRSIQLFEQDLDRARANASGLQDAAEQIPAMAELASQYAEYVRAAEALLDLHQEMAADLSAGSSYRALHRAHGSMMAQHRTARTRLRGLLGSFYQRYAPDTTAADVTDRPYALIPPYYARIAEARRDVTVRDLVALAQTGEPAPESNLISPDTSTTSGSEAEGTGSDVQDGSGQEGATGQ